MPICIYRKFIATWFTVFSFIKYLEGNYVYVYASLFQSLNGLDIGLNVISDSRLNGCKAYISYLGKH